MCNSQFIAHRSYLSQNKISLCARHNSSGYFNGIHVRALINNLMFNNKGAQLLNIHFHKRTFNICALFGVKTLNSDYF
jgi:hypothetical protein